MVVDLAYWTKILFWSGIILGSLSIGILGYAIISFEIKNCPWNWNRWKECKQQRQLWHPTQAPSNTTDSQIGDEEAAGDIPDRQPCVICLMMCRTFAFNPCGHLICCNRCAISVEREVTPKCPICRMTIRNSMWIYFS